MDVSVLYAVGTVLVVVGIVVIVAAIVAASTRGGEKGRGDAKVKAAGVIMIGPIPIIFGTDKKSVKAVLALALALVIAVIIVMLLYWLILR